MISIQTGAAVLAAATVLVCSAGAASYPTPLLGTAWYPQQWRESRWAHDLQLMQNALVTKHNIVVVVGTPCAAPPAWRTQKYPDTVLLAHG